MAHFPSTIQLRGRPKCAWFGSGGCYALRQTSRGPTASLLSFLPIPSLFPALSLSLSIYVHDDSPAKPSRCPPCAQDHARQRETRTPPRTLLPTPTRLLYTVSPHTVVHDPLTLTRHPHLISISHPLLLILEDPLLPSPLARYLGPPFSIHMTMLPIINMPAAAP